MCVCVCECEVWGGGISPLVFTNETSKQSVENQIHKKKHGLPRNQSLSSPRLHTHL